MAPFLILAYVLLYFASVLLLCTVQKYPVFSLYFCDFNFDFEIHRASFTVRAPNLIRKTKFEDHWSKISIAFEVCPLALWVSSKQH